MSKSLRRIRNFTVISLLSFSLLLLLSTLAQAQISSVPEPQIKGITKTIQGRLLTIPDFEHLLSTNLTKYRQSFESQISKLPQLTNQLKNVKFTGLSSKAQSFLPEGLLFNYLAIADNYWSKAEYTDSNVVTEQYVSGTVTCAGQNKPVAPPTGLAASYLELGDMAGTGGNHGKRWMSADQLVEGGCGILKAVNGGKEPAGRLVWGTDTFKIVLNKADEQTETATFSAYMHICANLPTGRTCTPYFIPLPWLPVSGHNWVVIGRGVS